MPFRCSPPVAACSCPATTHAFAAGYDGLSATDFVFVAGHFLARDENVFTLFEGQEPGAGGSAAVAQQVRRAGRLAGGRGRVWGGEGAWLAPDMRLLRTAGRLPVLSLTLNTFVPPLPACLLAGGDAAGHAAGC